MLFASATLVGVKNIFELKATWRPLTTDEEPDTQRVYIMMLMMLEKSPERETLIRW